MTVYACFCEVDHDCAPVEQWCQPCRDHFREVEEWTAAQDAADEYEGRARRHEAGVIWRAERNRFLSKWSR